MEVMLAFKQVGETIEFIGEYDIANFINDLDLEFNEGRQDDLMESFGNRNFRECFVPQDFDDSEYFLKGRSTGLTYGDVLDGAGFINFGEYAIYTRAINFLKENEIKAIQEANFDTSDILELIEFVKRKAS